MPAYTGTAPVVGHAGSLWRAHPRSARGATVMKPAQTCFSDLRQGGKRHETALYVLLSHHASGDRADFPSVFCGVPPQRTGTRQISGVFLRSPPRMTGLILSKGLSNPLPLPLLHPNKPQRLISLLKWNGFLPFGPISRPAPCRGDSRAAWRR